MEKLSRRNQLLVGITLFSMFFGAGNLIFPPFLGYQAGETSLPAFLGFAVSAAGLPILGVAAVARAGNLETLAGRVCKPFAAIYTMLIYLSIGPGLAMPRTASTSFEMGVAPFLGSGAPEPVLRVLYSALFFGAALLLALRPTKLIDFLGRRLGPVLLLLIATLFVGCLAHGFSGANQPAADYARVPAIQGFLDGYQTMDAIAALIFGVVLTINIRSRGVTEKGAVLKTTDRAGVIACALFVMVYGALMWVGTSGGYGIHAENGAQVLTIVADKLFGLTGQVILAAIFVVACLNTCVSLTCCCGEYFHRLMPKLSYRAWAVVFSVLSAVITNAGLNAILKISVPILGFLYPMAILLIAMAFLPDSFHKSRPLLYPLTIALAGAVSLVSSLKDAKLVIPWLTPLAARLPLSSCSLGWLLPAAVGFAVGALVRRKPTSMNSAEGEKAC